MPAFNCTDWSAERAFNQLRGGATVRHKWAGGKKCFLVIFRGVCGREDVLPVEPHVGLQVWSRERRCVAAAPHSLYLRAQVTWTNCGKTSSIYWPFLPLTSASGVNRNLWNGDMWDGFLSWRKCHIWIFPQQDIYSVRKCIFLLIVRVQQQEYHGGCHFLVNVMFQSLGTDYKGQNKNDRAPKCY